ncbi:MAG: polymer-forming cytoskeletal protein [Lachnospiraceae bacterium]|nr:polymer-forming cytoskeletal protein [Lachnospiraceae bacterium]
MGFFSDLKEDLSQAVNELLPDTEETSETKETETPENVETTVGLEDLNLSDMLDKLDQLGADMSFDSVEEKKAEEYVPEEPMDILAAASAILAEEEGNVEEQATAGASEEPYADVSVPVEEAAVVEAVPKWEETEEEQKAEEEKETQEESVPEKEDELSELDKMLQEADLTASPVFEAKEVAKEEKEMEVKRVATDETAIVTAGMTIRGDVETEGNLDLIGKVIGNIDILGKLNITGSVEGNSSAAEVYAEKAHIIGEVKSEGAVKIGQSSVIVGDVYGSSAVVAGAIKGDIDVKGPVILDSTAIVMGNIKSKSVQINNGAVIEGMCSQCYADVSPTTFFADLKFI